MRIILVLLLFAVALPVLAQESTPTPEPTPDPNLPVIGLLTLDVPVQETLTNAAFFDQWRITLQANDVIEVQMQASGGLEPLIGILNLNQDLEMRSDIEVPPERDGIAVVQYRAEADGEYTIVATRAGNQEGTSFGAYTLVATRLNDIPERPNDLVPVELRCDDMVWTVAAILEFTEETPAPGSLPEGSVVELYRLTVFGMDDFKPVILAEAAVSDSRLDCTRNGEAVPGSSYRLPGETPVQITEDDVDHVAQLSLRNSSSRDRFGMVRFTIGSFEGARGRYLAVLEGLALQNRDDQDYLLLSLAPLAKNAPVTVYMVGDSASRLDPALEAFYIAGDEITRCDDAGRTGCEAVQPFTGAGITLSVDSTIITGDRFDAGVSLSPGSTDAIALALHSRDNSTSGKYTVFILGELP